MPVDNVPDIRRTVDIDEEVLELLKKLEAEYRSEHFFDTERCQQLEAKIAIWLKVRVLI